MFNLNRKKAKQGFRTHKLFTTSLTSIRLTVMIFFSVVGGSVLRSLYGKSACICVISRVSYSQKGYITSIILVGWGVIALWRTSCHKSNRDQPGDSWAPGRRSGSAHWCSPPWLLSQTPGCPDPRWCPHLSSQTPWQQNIRRNNQPISNR